MKLTRAWTVGALAGALVLAAAGPAAAQDAAALAARRTLLEQAQQARDANNHAQALDLAERAGRIQMTPSVRLLIAQEQAALTRIAEAFGNADLCVREAERDTALRNRDTIIATCRALATDLRGRIGNVVVHVPQPTPAGLHVSLAGHDLPDTLWGVPYPVTAGRVTLEATATGYNPFRQELDVAAGQSVDAPVNLVQTPGAPPPPPPPPTVAAGGGPPIGPIVLIAAGGASIITGGIFLGLQRAELGNCPNDECADQATLDRVMSNANTDTVVMWTTFGVGAAAVAGGVVWLLMSGNNNSTPPRTAFTVSPTQGGAHFGLAGTF